MYLVKLMTGSIIKLLPVSIGLPVLVMGEDPAAKPNVRARIEVTKTPEETL